MKRFDPINQDAVAELRPDATSGETVAPIYDCWNRIGVEGNGTCRELVKYIHCRNCPVYSAAGIQLLDRPLTEDYRRERAEHYAQEKKVAQPVRVSVVIFRISNEWLALPTNAFQEVAERRAMHSLPHRRRGLALGLVNIRGELLICASAGKLLGLDQAAVREKSRVVFDRFLVAIWNGQRVAFPVDEVHGIQRFQKSELKDPPATISKSTLTYTEGVFTWRDRTIGLLDADSFFSTLNRSLA